MRAYPVTLELHVLWGDLDALGHVNNTKYFRWFESARILCFEPIGLSADSPSDIGPILATTTCNFRTPPSYPDRVIVGTRVPNIGNTSFVMEYGVARAAHPDELMADGSGVIVLVNYSTGGKVPVPDEMRTAIKAL